MEKLRKLFKGEQPSVKRFIEAIQQLSEQEQQQWYLHVYQLTFQNYPAHPKLYRFFL